MGPLLSARICRKYAAYCVQLAAATHDAEMRDRLIQVAAMWHRLADRRQRRRRRGRRGRRPSKKTQQRVRAKRCVPHPQALLSTVTPIRGVRRGWLGRRPCENSQRYNRIQRGDVADHIRLCPRFASSKRCRSLMIEWPSAVTA